MSTITAILTNKAYGYPTRGSRRRRKPTILACLHQTANARATAMQERNYANRTGSWGPSATAYIDRGGTVVRARRGGDQVADDLEEREAPEEPSQRSDVGVELTGRPHDCRSHRGARR